jgi:hypothetical protein
MIPGMHKKIKDLLDQILAHEGGEFIANSDGEATHIRQRCYRFRKWWRNNVGSLTYESLVIRQADNVLTFLIDPPLPGTVKLNKPTPTQTFDGEDVPPVLSDDEIAELVGDLGLRVNK